jgi:drug/metabolite transporter, DME family
MDVDASTFEDPAPPSSDARNVGLVPVDSSPTSTRRTPLVPSLMGLGAGIVWSFGSITARLAKGADAFQYLIWRSLGIILVVEAIGRLSGKPTQMVRAFTSGRAMHIANVMLLLASIGFVYAVKTTTVANAAFLGATTPVFGVILARIFLGERLDRVTVATVAAAFVGVTIMVAGDVAGGSMIGNLAALASAVGFAGYAVVVRSNPDEDWAPVLPGYGLLMIIICSIVTVAHGKPLVPPAHDIWLALLHGGVFIVVGTYLFNVASRRVPAAAMTIFAQTEMVLVPIWAFLILDDVPSATTLVGGLVIITAIVTKAAVDSQRQQDEIRVMEPF